MLNSDPAGEQVVVGTMTPNGPQIVGELPTHVNEATAMRNEGASHGPLYGGAGQSVPHQQSIGMR